MAATNNKNQRVMEEPDPADRENLRCWVENDCGGVVPEWVEISRELAERRARVLADSVQPTADC